MLLLQCQLGGCFLFRAWEAVVVGMVGAYVTCCIMPMLDKMHIDDPVGASATHGFISTQLYYSSFCLIIFLTTIFVCRSKWNLGHHCYWFVCR